MTDGHMKRWHSAKITVESRWLSSVLIIFSPNDAFREGSTTHDVVNEAVLRTMKNEA